MRIIITRHGETIENIKGILQGHNPGTLSEKGIEEAKKLANRLKKEKIDKIYSSDLGRASDTTKEILKYHPKAKVEYTKELRERDLGELTGKTKEELGIEKTKLIAHHINTEEGENLQKMMLRAKDFISRIINENEENILLVGHNGINTAIIVNFLDKGIDYFREIEGQKNTAVTIIKIKDGKVFMEIFNCTKHLEEDLE
jgi:broad specificity phosphatase PhoE